MSKEKTVSSPSLLSEMMHAGRFKMNQGKVARQVTQAAISLLFGVAAWQLYSQLFDFPKSAQLAIPGLLVLTGCWIAYRLVNWPTFANFLINVEAEMHKVSWPTKAELWRSVVVVIGLIFVLAMILFLFDLIWLEFFKIIRLIPRTAT